jgi:soluble lytic murein transglycosylase-like protein
MKVLLVAVSLALVPAARAVGGAAPAAAAEGKEKLLAEIEAWRGTQLPRVVPAAQITLRYEPRLDDIKSRAAAAKTEAQLAQPRREFQDWKQVLLHEKYGAAQVQGLAGGDFAHYAAEQVQQAEFSAALRQQVAQGAAQQAFVRVQQLSLTAGSNPASFFDLSRGRDESCLACVAAPAPVDAKDPARYAKVREILISQGARKSVVDMAIQEAIRQNADPLLVLSVIKAESGFNPHAQSGVGARGLMQIMPDTGRGLGVSNANNLYDVQTNLRAGIRYLKSLWGRFVGSDMMTALSAMNPLASPEMKSAVAAYNAGPGAVHKYNSRPDGVKKYGGVPPYSETRGYVKAVLGYYNTLKESLGLSI